MLLAIALAVTIAPPAEDIAFRQPQLATRGEQVAVTFGSTDRVHFALSRDGGKSFSAPVLVAAEGKLSLGRHRGPRIAFAGDAIVISAVVGKAGGGRDGDILSWRSTDGGATWSKGARVNDVEGAGREGLHAMASGGGVLFASWLDLRQKGTRLYGSLSKDGGVTWSKNVLVYESPEGHICECCHPSIKVTASGEIYVMWRNWLGGSRDMHVVHSKDGIHFSKAEKLGSGTWVLNACPMDGGDLGFDASGAVWSAFRRENNVILASPTAKESDLGKGKDPALAIGHKGPYVAWSDGGIQLHKPGESVVLDPAGAFVHLVSGDHVYAAWESGKQIRIARVD